MLIRRSPQIALKVGDQVTHSIHAPGELNAIINYPQGDRGAVVWENGDRYHSYYVPLKQLKLAPPPTPRAVLRRSRPG